MKLDNAALIYPATMNRNWTALFRISATLTDPIDPDILEVAQRCALKRCPSFSVKLRWGAFWFYLEHSEETPKIQPDVGNPCVRMRLKDNDGFGLRVRYDQNRIAIEFFHVLADGTGGLVLLQTLLAEYLRIKYGATIPRSAMVLDCSVPPKPEESEDSFTKHSGDYCQSRKESKAYHIRGTDEIGGFINIVTGTIPVFELMEKARTKNVSVNEYLTAVMILSIDAIQRRRVLLKKWYKPVKICVPINLRRFFPSVTLRNFASYVNPGIDPRLGLYTFDEVLNIVHHFMAMEVTAKLLNTKFTTNVRTQENPLLRATPLFLKNAAMKLVYSQVGDAVSSTCLSNLGIVTLPDAMAKYVNRMDFILGPLAKNRVCAAAMSYQGLLRLNFTRTIEEPVLEKEFFTRLVKLGIHVKIESNQQD
ncbi:MAG: alcohol acetyltransferase [Clostridia bacterium]